METVLYDVIDEDSVEVKIVSTDSAFMHFSVALFNCVCLYYSTTALLC